jgi:hypothetical protein
MSVAQCCKKWKIISRSVKKISNEILIKMTKFSINVKLKNKNFKSPIISTKNQKKKISEQTVDQIFFLIGPFNIIQKKSLGGTKSPCRSQLLVMKIKKWLPNLVPNTNPPYLCCSHPLSPLYVNSSAEGIMVKLPEGYYISKE